VLKAIGAGLDMEMTGGLYDRHLAAEVEAGRVPLAAVDEAVRRILRMKFRLGLFEKPDPDPSEADRAVLRPEARRAARLVARESLVLLQNRKATLPIAPEARRIAVVGALATSARDQLGPHEARGHVGETSTILDGMKARAEAAGAVVSYADGCDLYCTDTDGFARAAELARASDIVVAVLGEPRDLTGEGATRTRIGLPGHQGDLVRELAATGKPVVVVLMGGRPLELGTVTSEASAILMAWYPGTEGGAAVAEVLFGDDAPSGKLPHSWPRSVGQVPIYYDHLPSGRPTKAENRFTRKYIDEEVTPLFPFGWGLGYTEFSYSDLEASPPKGGEGGAARIRVTLTNKGARPGKEAVQLYVRDLVASRSRPVRELKGIRKLAIGPGESRLVEFDLPVRDLGFHDATGAYVVEPGRFQVWVGGSSKAELTSHFDLAEGWREEALNAPTGRDGKAAPTVR
jgi:beta-glucosidase